jgi:hypothetical protein
MSNFKYTAGLNHAGSFQVSGVPFVSASIDCFNKGGPVKITFPYVTKWIIVQNNSHVDAEDLRVGFSSLGITDSNNYFTVFNRFNATSQDRSSLYSPLELKVSEIYLSGSSNVEVIAGLTNIPTARVDNIAPSGSNWSGSIGVG